MTQLTDRRKSFAQLARGDRFAFVAPPTVFLFRKVGPRAAVNLLPSDPFASDQLSIRGSALVYPVPDPEDPARQWHPVRPAP